MAAAASDKVRFYMEQSVPELQEWERKEIFKREEITAIAQKRSQFEHILNMPGKATPADFARYAQYELNLDSLRKKRSKRLGVKATTYTGQKKVFFILERGVRKFPGDLALWMQYLEYVRKEAANKKLAKALTQCLRLHPLKWELWTWAAKFYLDEQADMQTARSYMQRGLRFCKSERRMWLEYAKLEMIYVAKIAARRKILGLDIEREQKKIEAHHDPDADMIALPDVTAEDLQPEEAKDTEKVDEAALQKMAASPALSGRIPEVVFDAAMRDFKHDPTVAEQFFDLFAEFDNVPCTAALLQHVMDQLTDPTNPKVHASRVICTAKLELVGMNPKAAVASADFPLRLIKCLPIIKQGMSGTVDQDADLAEKSVMLFLPYALQQELDEAIKKTLRSSIIGYLRTMSESRSKLGLDRVEVLLRKLRKENRKEELALLVELAGRINPAYQA